MELEALQGINSDVKALGAQVVVTPTNVPAEDPKSYYETAKRIAAILAPETSGGDAITLSGSQA